MATPSFEVEVIGAGALSPSVQGLSFARVDGAPMRFEPGQWVGLALPLDQGELRRSYSIASAPTDAPTFELAVTRVEGGQGSTYLTSLGAGARLVATGPQGFFTRAPEDPAPALFVGTGTGAAPLRSMLRAAIDAGSRAPLRFLMGVRTAADRLWVEELAALAAAHPNVRVEATLSRADDAWTGRRGHVQAHVRELWAELGALGAGEPHAWICGLERMVSSVRELLRKDLGVPRQRVHSERYD